jgi:hypothetical protein
MSWQKRSQICAKKIRRDRHRDGVFNSSAMAFAVLQFKRDGFCRSAGQR